jgi:pimeloyl-ACP methyl ester carboxylesterase
LATVSPATASTLDVTRIGTGPAVVFVHGSIVGAELTWRHQRPLARRWTLCLPNRPGFGASPPLERGDFEVEAPLHAELLGEGAHLVGHSYGAVIALYAATLRPDAVRSLTVSEPGALRLAAGVPAVDAAIADGEELYRRRDEIDPREFLQLFRLGVGSTHRTPGVLPEPIRRGVELLLRERPPWEAEVPIDDLARAPFGKLVVSGGHSEVFESVCDALAYRIGARRRVVAGRGHTIPACGPAYNRCLEEFLAECQRRPERGGPT